MNTFKVKYYNGKISKGFDASLLLEPDGWEIRFIDENNKSQIIFWELKGIKSDTFLGASNRFVYGSSAPKEVIECDTELFNKTLKSTYKNAFSVHQKYRFFENFSVLKILILTVLLISILLGFYFYLLPNIAVSIANKMPKSAEIDWAIAYMRVFPKTWM